MPHMKETDVVEPDPYSRAAILMDAPMPTTGPAATDERLQRVRAAWAEMHRKNSPCFGDPVLVGAVVEAVNHLAHGQIDTGSNVGMNISALLPRDGTCALVAALAFPEGGGLVLDPKLVLASDFFEASGPVHIVLPDFLGDPSRTGRTRLPPWRLGELFTPLAESWLKLSIQVAKLIEQVVWLLLEPTERGQSTVTATPVCGSDGAAGVFWSLGATPEIPVATRGRGKGITRRQRKREVAIRRKAAALATAPVSAEVGIPEEAIDADAVDVQDNFNVHDVQQIGFSSHTAVLSDVVGAMMAGTIEPEAAIQDEIVGNVPANLPEVVHHQVDTTVMPEKPLKGMVEDVLVNDQVAYLSITSGIDEVDDEAKEHYTSDSLDMDLFPQETDNSLLWSPRKSKDSYFANDPGDPMNLCEVNTASWSSRSSKISWLATERTAHTPLARLAWNSTEVNGADQASRDAEDPEGIGLSGLNLKEINACSWSSRGSAADAALNLCEINTASWSSRCSRTPWAPWSTMRNNNSDRWALEMDDPEGAVNPTSLSLRDINASSWSSRGSATDNAALNLCEINTASWGSTGSRSAWFVPYHSKQQARIRTAQEIVEDLAKFGRGLHPQAGDNISTREATGASHHSPGRSGLDRAMARTPPSGGMGSAL